MTPHILFTCTLSSKTKRHTHVPPASAAAAVRCRPHSRAEGATQLQQGWRRKRKQTGKMETRTRRRKKKKEERKKEQKVLGWSRCGWGRHRWCLVSGCWRWFWSQPSSPWNSSDLSGPEGTQKYVDSITMSMEVNDSSWVSITLF